MDYKEDLPVKKKASVPQPKIQKDEVIAGQVERLASLALSKNAIAIACRLTPDQLERHYKEEFLLGQAKMQADVAGAAMEQVRKGNPAMIMFIAKSRLGWTETNVVEHVGEIRAVVSNRPLTREEFASKYLEQSDVIEAEVVEESKADTVGVRDTAREATGAAVVSEVSGVSSDNHASDGPVSDEVSD